MMCRLSLQTVLQSCLDIVIAIGIYIGDTAADLAAVVRPKIFQHSLNAEIYSRVLGDRRTQAVVIDRVSVGASLLAQDIFAGREGLPHRESHFVRRVPPVLQRAKSRPTRAH